MLYLLLKFRHPVTLLNLLFVQLGSVHSLLWTNTEYSKTFMLEGMLNLSKFLVNLLRTLCLVPAILVELFPVCAAQLLYSLCSIGSVWYLPYFQCKYRTDPMEQR